MLPFLALVVDQQKSWDFTASAMVAPGRYTVAPDSGGAAMRVDADDVTIDFQGAIIESPKSSDGKQETYDGVGLLIDGHKNITIKNAKIRGFQYDLKALKCAGLNLVDCDFSQSRSQKVMNGDSPINIFVDIRDLPAWREYGAGAWLEGCSDGRVANVTANHSQNGLLMVDCDSMKVIGCDFGYNSGWGLALWHSSQNLICWNHMDFCNRPWAGGWGGDSSGVVFATGSDKNVLADNSFTHSGDGFFLATQNGGFDAKGALHEEGTCDGNVIAYNDGSWSTANAFESTFSSRNVFYKDRADDSNYGFWLGYSKDNTVVDNEIIGSHVDGIATEQGARNSYGLNDIEKTGQVAIHLWGGAGQKFSQSPSSGNIVDDNKIVGARAGLDLTNSSSTSVSKNTFQQAPLPAGLEQTSLQSIGYKFAPSVDLQSLKPAGFTFYRETDLPKGWQWLSATTYGMRDYRDLLVPWAMKDARTVMLYVRPDKVKKLVVPKSMTMVDGSEPFEKLVTFNKRKESVGVERPFTIYAYTPEGKAQFISGHILDVNWHVKWFKWFRNDHDAYADAAGWKSLFSGPALREEELPALPNIPGYAAPETGLPVDHFALVATTKVGMLKGKYRFDTVSDDGIQVFVDGKKIIDNWTHHGAMSDHATIDLDTGVHEVRVNYCQEDGGAALSVVWTKA